jgi:hypothetical protein
MQRSSRIIHAWMAPARETIWVMAKTRHRVKFTSRPATDKEIAAAAAANGVKSLDDPPPRGTKVFHGYGELLSELEKSKRRKRAARS